MQNFEILVDHDEDIRLDVYLTRNTSYSRSRINELILSGNVFIDKLMILKPAIKVVRGMHIQLNIPDVVEPEYLPEDIPLDILYQDDDIAVINKPAGMVVHPAAGNENGTLVNALLFSLKDLSGIGGEKRPGIVHRLDKDTSGVIVVAKNDFAHLELSRQFNERIVEKHYRSVVLGTPKDENGVINVPVGRSISDRKKMTVRDDGKPAITEWTVLERLKQSAMLDVRILTGRTHQIRVHMKHIGHPVLGDPIYGTRNHFPVKISRLLLHSYSIKLFHPSTGKKMQFVAPIPLDFQKLVMKLR